VLQYLVWQVQAAAAAAPGGSDGAAEATLARRLMDVVATASSSDAIGAALLAATAGLEGKGCTGEQILLWMQLQLLLLLLLLSGPVGRRDLFVVAVEHTSRPCQHPSITPTAPCTCSRWPLCMPFATVAAAGADV